MNTITTPTLDEAALLAKLESRREKLLARHIERAPYNREHDVNQQGWATEIHLLCDLLVEYFGWDRSELSEQHGWGRIVRESGDRS